MSPVPDRNLTKELKEMPENRNGVKGADIRSRTSPSRAANESSQ